MGGGSKGLVMLVVLLVDLRKDRKWVIFELLGCNSKKLCVILAACLHN